VVAFEHPLEVVCLNMGVAGGGFNAGVAQELADRWNWNFKKTNCRLWTRLSPTKRWNNYPIGSEYKGFNNTLLGLKDIDIPEDPMNTRFTKRLELYHRCW